MRARLSAQSTIRWLMAGAGLALVTYATYVGAAWLRYGHVASPSVEEDDPLLDQFMPHYDVVERRHTRIAAPADVAMAAANAVDIQRMTVARVLFKSRALLMRSHEEEVAPTSASQALIPWMQRIGWQVLADIPDHEVVVGSVTQPWNATPTFQGIAPEDFAAFHEPEYVKIAWTLRAEPSGAGASTLYHETRAVATDAAARAKFRRYWAAFSPGIILIRWVLLGPASPIKREAARRARSVGGATGRAELRDQAFS